MLRKMTFGVEFDRKVDCKEHYISPGGYEIDIDREKIQFDFCNFAGDINKQNPTVVNYEVYIPDTEAFPEMERLTFQMLTQAKNLKFEDFFIYTGEYDDPEIIPLFIEDLILYFDEGIFEWPEKKFKAGEV